MGMIFVLFMTVRARGNGSRFLQTVKASPNLTNTEAAQGVGATPNSTILPTVTPTVAVFQSLHETQEWYVNGDISNDAVRHNVTAESTSSGVLGGAPSNCVGGNIKDFGTPCSPPHTMTRDQLEIDTSRHSQCRHSDGSSYTVSSCCHQ